MKTTIEKAETPEQTLEIISLSAGSPLSEKCATHKTL